MKWLKWSVVFFAPSEAGWMLFDGSRALIVGDYVTPQSGERKGELGPWAAVVAALGIEPRATLMKCIFVAYGLGWLAIIAAFAAGVRRARLGMVLSAAGSLWYLPVGTTLSVIQLAFLIVLRRRQKTG